ncbi:MAG: VCBS repeat-containing protein [Chloroherpetonaceae bacterium]|nr:VCBS repeat-containing protein [Chloroherpetonaceae bacterium]
MLLTSPTFGKDKETIPPTFYRYDVALEYRASRAVAGDFNGDYTLDLALIEPPLNRLTILYGGASLDEFSPKFFALLTSVQDIGASDLNNDGITDLIFLTRSPERLLCYYAASGERLTLRAEIEVTAGAEKIAIMPALHHTSILLYGQMRGIEQVDFSPHYGFVKRACFLSESVISELTFAESLSKDKLSHLIAHSAVEQCIKFIRTDKDSLLGTVSLSFNQPIASIAASDFNQNGLPDLALGLGQTRTLPAEICVLFDLGVQTGSLPVYLPLNHSPSQLLSADFNHDGVINLLALNPTVQAVTLFLGKSGSRVYEPHYLGIDAAAHCTVQDLNGDELPEIIFTQPSEKQVVIFSATPPRNTRKPSLLWGRLVLSPHPTTLMLFPRKSQALIATFSKGQSVLSAFTYSKSFQAQKPLAIGYRTKLVCQLGDEMQFAALSEKSDKVSVFSFKPLFSLEKQAETSILALNITHIEHWWRAPSLALLFLLDESRQAILPQLLLYRQTRTHPSSLSEVTFAPFVPVGQLVSVQATKLYGQPVLAAIERHQSEHLRARLYTFGMPMNQHVQLFEKAQIRLLQTEAPPHTALCEDFDGDGRPDWLLANQHDTWLLLSRQRYKAESLSKLIGLSEQDVVRVIDINSDRHLDLLVCKAQEQKLYVMLGNAAGKFSSLKTLANYAIISDAKLLRIDGETLLLVTNTKLHTLNIIKLDSLFAESTATQ